MSAPSSSNFFAGLSDYAGTVTFATVIVMLCIGQYKPKFDLRSSAKWMVYFDVFAFVIAYTGLVLADRLDTCGSMYFWFAADIIWCFKDGFKYTFIVYRCTRISGSLNRLPSYLTFGISIALYFLYMSQVYNFHACATNHSGHVANHWATILLYSVWMVIDIVASVVMIRKLTQVVSSDVTAFPSRMELYKKIVFREEARLLVATVAMGIVTVLVILNVFKEATTPPIAPIAFVYVQLILFMSSTKIDPGTPSSAPSDRGVTRSTHGSGGPTVILTPKSPNGRDEDPAWNEWDRGAKVETYSMKLSDVDSFSSRHAGMSSYGLRANGSEPFYLQPSNIDDVSVRGGSKSQGMYHGGKGEGFSALDRGDPAGQGRGARPPPQRW
ncbi:hypothetical protein HK104_001286 [Borealophlyctis nickersoniae]|nr:hypothetical protein HK104_001286 [Borealophlyctis nickersoniae]